MARLVLSLILFMWLLESCVYNHTDNIEDLGNGYYYLGDGSESQILQGTKPNDYSFGITIVPQEVIEYNFDNSHIIAKSIVYKLGVPQAKYWIIEKTKKNQAIIPLDSITFSIRVKKENIQLELQNRK